MLLSERYRTTKDERRGRFEKPSYYDSENDEDATGLRANELNTRSMHNQDRRVLKKATRNSKLDNTKVHYGSVDDEMMKRRNAHNTDLQNNVEWDTKKLKNYIKIIYRR